LQKKEAKNEKMSLPLKKNYRSNVR